LPIVITDAVARGLPAKAAPASRIANTPEVGYPLPFVEDYNLAGP
jgi:hypothetical protein